MARAQNVSKTLHYKRATYLQNTGVLQKHLKEALDDAKKVGERKQVINATENTLLLLNSVRARWGMLFGSMILYSRDKNQPLVTPDDTAEELTVEQMAPPPTREGARREFVESLLFFGIKDNHIVLLQSAGLRARQFEAHLAWLLQTKTKVLDDDDQVVLADQPTQKAVKHVLKSPVKKVTVGMPLQTRSSAPTQSTRQVSFQPKGDGFSVLRTLLGADWFKRLDLDESLDESRLRVQVQVSYTRTTDPAAQDLLNDIAVQMRNQEPEDVEIELTNGVKLSGDQLKVAGPIPLTTYGGLVSPEELFPQMRDWLKEQLEQGIVEA